MNENPSQARRTAILSAAVDRGFEPGPYIYVREERKPDHSPSSRMAAIRYQLESQVIQAEQLLEDLLRQGQAKRQENTTLRRKLRAARKAYHDLQKSHEATTRGTTPVQRRLARLLDDELAGEFLRLIEPMKLAGRAKVIEMLQEIASGEKMLVSVTPPWQQLQRAARPIVPAGLVDPPGGAVGHKET